MNSENGHLVCGINFSGRFCSELRRLLEQLGNDKHNTIADIQRVRRRREEEPSEHDWAIYFVAKNIVSTKDILILDGLPIHIRPEDKVRLHGKVVDFERNLVVVTECSKSSL